MSLKSPAPLINTHSIDDFNCGIPSLDEWLKRRALTNQNSGATRTFVICVDDFLSAKADASRTGTLRERVVGYYALAAGSINVQSALGKFRRNMPDPIPVVILARLAIDTSYQGRGLGRALFRDAALRVIQAADPIGIRGIIVHAISAEAKDFYVALGFRCDKILSQSTEPLSLLVVLLSALLLQPLRLSLRLDLVESLHYLFFHGVL
jgi:GNAT superfamily N-acetyltransferase